jgi:chorismate mutase
MVRAVRGATTVKKDNKSDISDAVRELIKAIISANNIRSADMISIFFTATRDLVSAFPAEAVRESGITDIPMMCSNELYIKGSLKKCIRVMIYFNTDKGNDEIKHVYLRTAKKLRPDLAGESS